MVAAAAPAGPVDEATMPYDGGNVSPVRRQVLESYFPPGTLALVLPPDSLPAAAAAAAAEVAEVAGSQIPPRREDVEMGRTSRVACTEAEPPLTPVSPSVPSVVIPLTVRLAGIGVYYMDEKVGGANGGLTALPPVLIHFMRNVHAIHDVCVFLSVRRLPTPSIPRRNRLHIYTPHSATPPNFYQVVARYGYLDQINHGSAFISELLDAILKRLVAAVSVLEGRGDRGQVWNSDTVVPGAGGTITGGEDTSRRYDREVVGGVTDGGHLVQLSPDRGVSGDQWRQRGEVKEEGLWRGEVNCLPEATGLTSPPWAVGGGAEEEVGSHRRNPSARPLARRGQHSPAVSLRLPSLAPPPPPPQPMHSDGITEGEGSTDPKMDRSVGGGGRRREAVGFSEHDVGPYIGGSSGGRDNAQGHPGGGGERQSAEAEEKDGQRKLLPCGGTLWCSGGITTSTAASAGLGDSDIRSCVEGTVAAFLEARLHGVVYYASRALIRATPPANSSPLTQLFEWLVYGLVFRWLAAISYVDMERWKVPADKLVELGMQVDIGGGSPAN
ncbi:hypothetical protein Vafri_1743 [Volvox africanus]|nr:hypothetical protein Vafri_1743 [Volvox africanus]